jgi:serine/threonine protein kinase/Tfp pilus assembly protein PilF
LSDREIFDAALAFADPAQRSAYLDQACSGDAARRRQIEGLLDMHAQLGSFLESPAVAEGMTVDQPASPERPGTVIGLYKLLQQIGEGGMGTVWMAEQTQPVQRKVALKVIKPGMDSRQVVARFEAERQALAMMDHVNIARVLDAGATASGLPYFVMELVHGMPITKYCDDNQLTPRERLELFVPVCQAIQHAHQKGIIHRDIKPSNVMVTLYDGKPVPKVIDFGVAKATEQALTERTMFTQYGTIVGTLEYMSPEQAEMSGLGVDTRGDIYSLGVLLYELLTGSTPLERPRLRETAYAEALRLIREEEAPKPSKRLSSSDTLTAIAAARRTEPAKLAKLLRGELDWIVLKALEKDRTRRYETANSFVADVQRYLKDEPVEACPPSAWYWFRKFARRNKRGLATALLILCFIVLLGGSVGWMWHDRAARRLVVEQAVARALDEADGLEEQGKWQEALLAVERAEASLASGEAGSELQEQVRERLADLRMIQRLEELRIQRSDHLDSRTQDQAYAGVFAEFGIDVESLSPAEIAARIGRQPAHAVRVAAALDDWAQARQFQLSLHNPKHDPATWKRLLEAACLADPDPWRIKLRQLFGQEDLSVLQKLAASSDVAALPVQSLQLMGHALISHGDGPACVAWLRQAQRRHPGDAIINFDLAFHLGELPSPPWDEVLRFCQAALAARPWSERMHVCVGDTLLRMGRWDEALAQFSKVIELKADKAAGWCGRGRAYANLSQWDKAFADFSKAIELDPKEPFVRHIRGNAYAGRGDWDKAVADFAAAVRLKPDDHFLRYLLAFLHLQVADTEGYRQDCKVMLNRFGQTMDPTVAHRVALICLLRPGPVSDRQQVLQLAERGVAGRPEDAWHLLTLGAAHYRAGQGPQAIRWLDPDQATPTANYYPAIVTQLFLAMAHQSAGHNDEARRSLDSAIQKSEKELLSADTWHCWILCQCLRQEAEALLKIEKKPMPE